MPSRQTVLDSHFASRTNYWKNVYKREDLGAKIFQERNERSLQWIHALRLQTGTKALDAGCGAGITAVGLASLGFDVHAVDRVDAMLASVRETAERAGVQSRVTPSIGDIRMLDFSKDNFGLVVSLGVIAWLDSPEEGVRELARVLRPGGYLVLAVGNSQNLSDWLNPPYIPFLAPLRRFCAAWLRRMGWLAPSASAPPDRHMRPAQVDRILQAAGLRKVNATTIGFGPFSLFKTNLFPNRISLRIHNLLQSLADHKWPLVRSTGAHYLVLAVKPECHMDIPRQES